MCLQRWICSSARRWPALQASMGPWRDVWKEKSGAYVALVADILILSSLMKRSLWNGDPLRLQTALARSHFIKGRFRILCVFFSFRTFWTSFEFWRPVVLDFIGLWFDWRPVPFFRMEIFLSAGLGLVEKELGNLLRFFTGFSKTAKWLITLPETNIDPENRPSQKGSSIPNSNFQGLCKFHGG